jgi:hypothetical protein
LKVKKTILVISDSHGQYLYLDRLQKKLKKPDYIIHLGDVARDQDYISALFGCTVDMVAGNNDFFTELPGEFTIREGRHIIWLTHGHGYGVYNGTKRLVQRAKALGADTVMFGHTHCPCVDFRDDVQVINPGSISLPRQERRKPTYILMQVGEDGEIDYRVYEV